MTVEDLALGVALAAVGIAVVAWSLIGDTYDDRLEDRSLKRIREVGWGYDPVPITKARRISGTVFGALIAGAGAWWLMSGHGG